MSARLNRRRYKEVVKALKEVIADPKATRMQRLRAVDTLIGVYDRTDRSSATREARKRASEAEDGTTQVDATADQPMVQETPEQKAERFLASIQHRGNDEQE